MCCYGPTIGAFEVALEVFVTRVREVKVAVSFVDNVHGDTARVTGVGFFFFGNGARKTTCFSAYDVIHPTNTSVFVRGEFELFTFAFEMLPFEDEGNEGMIEFLGEFEKCFAVSYEFVSFATVFNFVLRFETEAGVEEIFELFGRVDVDVGAGDEFQRSLFLLHLLSDFCMHGGLTRAVVERAAASHVSCDGKQLHVEVEVLELIRQHFRSVRMTEF